MIQDLKQEQQADFVNKEAEEPLLEQDRQMIDKMKAQTEDFLNYEVKELNPLNQQEAKIYLSLIRNIHSRKIKGFSN